MASFEDPAAQPGASKLLRKVVERVVLSTLEGAPGARSNIGGNIIASQMCKRFSRVCSAQPLRRVEWRRMLEDRDPGSPRA